jgi:5-oxoprolinase (ATP-hydrolysing) subunit A
MARIDLNCDLGEGAGQDAELMPLITSANIACGAHAGDAATMRATVELARQQGVAIGAHPGFADREHFGRRELAVTPEEVFQLVRAQTFALRRMVEEAGARLGHVKLHGALYNLAARDAAIAEAAAYAVRDAGPELVWFGLAGSATLAVVRACGLSVAEEVFADRTYQPDGSLTPRSRPDALIASEEEAVAQALRLVREGRVRTTDGRDIALRADTLCLHGDGVHAVGFARRIRAAFAEAGLAVRAAGSGG